MWACVYEIYIIDLGACMWFRSEKFYFQNQELFVKQRELDTAMNSLVATTTMYASQVVLLFSSKFHWHVSMRLCAYLNVNVNMQASIAL